MKLKLKIKATGKEAANMAKSVLHPGFAKVAAMISKKSGGNGAVILANSSRNASAQAKRKNPRLLKVK